MSIAQTNMIAKIAAVVAGLGLVAMSFASFAVPAKADTTSDLAAQIAALQAQLAALQAQAGGSSSSASVTFSTDLTMGSKGADVTALQNWLIGKGFKIAAGATGYFGAQTKAAVAAWQASAGITPAAGYFGPKSRAAANAAGGSTTGTTGGTSTTGLTGTGYLTSISTLGDVTSDVREGDMGDQVIGFSARAVNGDVALDRLDVKFTTGQGTGSTALNRYMTSVSVWQDGKKLATMSPTDGSYQNKVWTLRFSNLGGAVIKNGQTSNIHVAIDAVSAVNSLDSGQTVTAEIPTDGLRVNDAQGTSDTYVTDFTQNFTVSAANKGVLTLTEAADDPAATTIKADLNNTTSNVTLLAFNAKATNQNVKINALPVNIIANAANVSDYVQTVSLMQGSNTISTKTLSSSTNASQQVVFDNINQSISKDSTTEYTVVATIKKIDAGGTNTFGSGDQLHATTSAAVNSAFDVQDANGNSVTPTGTVVGNTMTFQATGVTVTKVAATTSTTVGTTAGSGDVTQYAIQFKMTAGDTDLYVPATVTRALTASAQSVTWATTTTSTASSTDMGTASLSASDTNTGDVAGSYFKVPAGQTRTFTLNVALTEKLVGSAGFTGVQLTGIGYGTTTTMSANYLTYTSNISTFKTNDVSMTTH